MKTEIEKQNFIDKIVKKLSAYEEERKQRILGLLIKQIITLAIGYATCKGAIIWAENHTVISVFCAFIALFSGIVLFCNFSDDNKEFKTYLKKKCKRQILKEFGLTTMDGECFSDETLKKSNLFPLYSYQEHDDVIEGCYNEVNYTIAETKLVVKNRKNEFDVFKGVIISFKSNKKILAETLVTSKGDNHIRNYPPSSSAMLILVPFLLLLPILLSFYFLFQVGESFKSIGGDFSAIPTPHLFWSSIFLPNLLDFLLPIILILGVGIPLFYQMKKMQKVKLEDVGFDKRFNVYTKDQVEARYLLTPTFMERLKHLETSFGTRGIKCSFFDDCIMFAISSKKDLFELGSLYKSLKSKKSVEEFYNEIQSVQNMIDYLKLNEKTGL